MKPVKYEALTEELLEDYPVEEHPEIYSLYTQMKQHLMKVYNMKATTAHKFLVKIEERLGIHLYRNRELSAMKMINVTKGNDVKKYFRTLYWTSKLPLETVNEIYDKYKDISSAIVKKYMHATGKLNDDQIADYEYSCNYYREHRAELLEKKREYRAKIKRLNNDKR